VSTIDNGQHEALYEQAEETVRVDEEKREICAQATTPGISVAQVARRYAVNADLIFKWQKDPRFKPEADELAKEPTFLPIEIESVGAQEALETDKRRRQCPQKCVQCATISGPHGLIHGSRYHRRSRVETKMHCIKLLGQSLMTRDFDRQVTDIQILIAVLNRYTAPSIPITKPAG